MNTDEHRFYIGKRPKDKKLNGTRINADETGKINTKSEETYLSFEGCRGTRRVPPSGFDIIRHLRAEIESERGYSIVKAKRYPLR
jgi:hypothetical protein